MFENIMDAIKKDRMRFLAIGIILLFVFSTIAIYMSSANNASSGSSGTKNPSGENITTSSFSGKGRANATLRAWEPVMVVRSSDSRMADKISELMAQGIVTNNIPQAGANILTLSDSKLMFNTTRELLRLNATVSASATISIPQASVTDSAGVAHIVSGGTYTYTGTPEFDEGDGMQILFDTYVQEGRMPYNPVNIVSLEGDLVDAEVAPQSVNVSSKYWRGLVDWTQRGADIGQYQANLIGGSKVKYRQRSIVMFLQPISDTQIATLKSAKFSWSTGDFETTLAGVNTAYTNRSQIESDLGASGIQPIFPASIVEVTPYIGNRSETEIESDLARTWNDTFPTLNVTFRPAYRLEVALPAALGVGNQTYRLLQTQYNVSSNYAPAENNTLKISFRPRGKQIDGLETASYSPAGMVEELEAN